MSKNLTATNKKSPLATGAAAHGTAAAPTATAETAATMPATSIGSRFYQFRNSKFCLMLITAMLATLGSQPYARCRIRSRHKRLSTGGQRMLATFRTFAGTIKGNTRQTNQYYNHEEHK